MERGHQNVPGYDASREREHHLGILIGQDVSAWVAHDLRTLQPVAMGWGPDTDALRSADLPKQPRSVTYVSLPEWSTLVPDGALEPTAAASHLSLVHGKLPHDAVRDEPVRTLGASCIYVHDEAHVRVVLERFPNARSLPLQALLVRGAQARSSSAPVILVHRGKDRADIAVARGQEILLTSSYPARTAEDLLYFCLMAAERCGLQPTSACLRSGGTHLQHNERELLTRYFADHDTAVPFRWPGSRTNEHEADRWLAAFDQFACVS